MRYLTVVAIVMIGCSADAPATADGRTSDSAVDSPVSCPAIAASCPSGCGAFRAAPYDAVRNCILPTTIVGCTAPDVVCTGDISCQHRASDDAVFRFHMNCFVGSPSWKRCETALYEKLMTAPACP